MSPVHATCPSQLILLDLITLIIFDEAYKLYTYIPTDVGISTTDVKTHFHIASYFDEITVPPTGLNS
jgi:hypothetical protein